jgi:hypothetical protein
VAAADTDPRLRVENIHFSNALRRFQQQGAILTSQDPFIASQREVISPQDSERTSTRDLFETCKQHSIGWWIPLDTFEEEVSDDSQCPQKRAVLTRRWQENGGMEGG